MKNEEILYALTDVREEFIEEAAPTRRRPARRLLTVAAAAALALLLMGAAVIYGESIQSWMAQRWAWENGGSMSGDQTVLVDSMSQEIGLSQTIGDITVDVDSALFGDRGFKVLLRVRVREFTMGEGIAFTDWTMELEPDPTVGMGHGRGWEFAGIDNDGTLLLFFECNWDAAKRPDAPFTVRLSMTDLVSTGAGGVVEEVIQEGTWEFEFPLEVTGVPEPIALPDCTVRIKDPESGKMVDVELKKLTLYSTGLSYEKADPAASSVGVDVTVVLKSGGSIRATLGIGDTRWWDVPVDPAEVKELRIGQTTIPVNME